MNFGLKLKNIRKVFGLQQKELAALIGCCPSTVCIWEKGDADLPASAIRVIHSKLGVSYDYLLEEPEA
jgi:transcriptional regulator with XRE-family HTH domain